MATDAVRNTKRVLTVKEAAKLMPTPQPAKFPQTKAYDDALGGLVAPEFLHSQAHQKQHFRAVTRGEHPVLTAFGTALVRKMRSLNIPMYTHTAIRGREEQTRVYVQGFSKSPYGNSAHNFGMARDIVHGVWHWEMPKQAWDIIGELGKELATQRGYPVMWGGDWKSPWDPAHWFLRDWKEWKEYYPWINPADEKATPLDRARWQAWELQKSSMKTAKRSPK